MHIKRYLYARVTPLRLDSTQELPILGAKLYKILKSNNFKLLKIYLNLCKN